MAGSRGTGSDADARAELDRARVLLAIPDRQDPAAATQIGDLIEAAIKNKEALPSDEAVRRRIAAGVPVLDELPTVGEWLDRWLPTRRSIAKNTWRSYESHIRLYLRPAVGRIRIDRQSVQ